MSSLNCSAGFHETPLSTLFGSVLTPSTTEKLCAPDADSCDGLFGCAVQALSDVKGIDVLKATAQGVGTLAAFYSTGGLSVVGDILQGVAVAEGNRDLLKASQIADLAATAFTADYSNLSELGDDTMGFFDSLGDFSFDAITDFGSTLVDEVDWGSVGSFALDTYQTFLPAGNQVQAIPVAASAKNAMSAAAGAIAKVGPTVGRSFFNKWPNLATAIQKMKNAGHNVSRSKLYSMLKRFGPEFLVTAGIMSAAAVSELILAGPGHRRMNPANSKALRRATRRIKSFHRLCGEADVIKTRRRSCAKKC